MAIAEEMIGFRSAQKNDRCACDSAIDADLCVTLMASPLGDARRAWHRFRVLKDMQTPVWVLSHRDLKTTARVRAVRDFIGDALARAASR